MPASRPPLSPPVRRRLVTAVGGASAVLLTLSACGLGGGSAPDAGPASPGAAGGNAPSGTIGTEPASPALLLTANVRPGASGVPVDKVLSARASGGKVTRVQVTSKAGKVPGTIAANGSSWRADGLLEPGATYTMKVTGVGDDGRQRTTRTTFTTKALTLAQQTYPSVTPMAGQTVGIGMPVVVRFDVAVTDKASFEKHMHVTSTPAQPGSWYWVSDHEAHWRPKHFWKGGTKVDVKLDLNSVPAGNGIYGQMGRDVHFKVGDAHIYKVNMKTDEMRVYSNGKLIRTLPVTTGKTGFSTRSGIKVISSMTPSMEMSSATIGIPINSANGYDIKDVQWDMRLTNSGEFIHAAPWSESEQGSANVSHGCTGLSTANAEWLYRMSQVGDVVIETGTDRPMEFTNGYGDWNMSFKDYEKGSALKR